MIQESPNTHSLHTHTQKKNPFEQGIIHFLPKSINSTNIIKLWAKMFFAFWLLLLAYFFLASIWPRLSRTTFKFFPSGPSPDLFPSSSISASLNRRNHCFFPGCVQTISICCFAFISKTSNISCSSDRFVPDDTLVRSSQKAKAGWMKVKIGRGFDGFIPFPVSVCYKK